MNKFFEFWKRAIIHQIEKPLNKSSYFIFGFITAHTLYNLIELII